MDVGLKKRGGKKNESKSEDGSEVTGNWNICLSCQDDTQYPNVSYHAWFLSTCQKVQNLHIWMETTNISKGTRGRMLFLELHKVHTIWQIIAGLDVYKGEEKRQKKQKERLDYMTTMQLWEHHGLTHRWCSVTAEVPVCLSEASPRDRGVSVTRTYSV